MSMCWLQEEQQEVSFSGAGVDGDSGTVGFSKFTAAPRRPSRRNLCLLFIAALLLFIIGYIMGYVLHRKPTASAGSENNKDPSVISVFPEKPEPNLSWANITKILEDKLTSQAFTNTLNEIDKVPHRPAGSEWDESLGNVIYHEFTKLNMEPWINVHSVRLPTPDRDRRNRVTFGRNVFMPQGFLAYSGTGQAQGKLVYANYGRPEDFAVVKKYNVEVSGSVVMMRCGKISFAEKVANAEGRGAKGVLIYPDNQILTDDTEIFGHVHFGSGDPFTPGFPSFNQTMFPPTKSSGLPKIPAQTITANMAKTILQTIGGPAADTASGFKNSLGGIEDITVEVNNVLVFREFHNVFGVIKGFIDPDRYVVVGAQRDTLGLGYARSTVGTSVLIELAKAVHEMVVKDRFRPRRSIVFASWSAGEYGVGATEWLEAYLSSLDKSVFAYISLDGIVQGSGSFYASGSPLLQTLLENTLKAVRNPSGPGTVFDIFQNPLHRPMSTDDPAYPFMASFGIPSISFHFSSPNAEEYVYFNTLLDNKDHLNYQTAQRTSSVTASAAQIAGQMALRLVHDHIISFDVSRYIKLLNSEVFHIFNRIHTLQKSGKLRDVSSQWLGHARGSFFRAADGLQNDIMNTDLMDPEACRLLNDRLMRIEPSLLSPYTSPFEHQYRHLLFGRGPYTLTAIAEAEDEHSLRTPLALSTWTIQASANSMAANIWDIDYQM